MNKQEKQESRRLPGFYIALCCCVIAVGVAGYFTERAGIGGSQTTGIVSGDDVPSQDVAVLNPDDGAVPANIEADNVTDTVGMSGAIFICGSM